MEAALFADLLMEVLRAQLLANLVAQIFFK